MSLRDRVTAERFTAGRPAQVARGITDLRQAPSRRAPLGSQLLSGEPVTVFDEADGWSWVQAQGDAFVGYAESVDLSDDVQQTTHRVTALGSFRYPEPDLKAPPIERLTLAGQVAVVGARDRFSELAGGGWVFTGHLAPLHETAPDHVASALRLIGVPYLWGGKGSLGIDCSGLVQITLALAGRAAPRDGDLQAASLGTARAEGTVPERGDLIYLPGHVVIALDTTRVVHAHAGKMEVGIEPLADVVERVRAESGRGIDVIRRVSGLAAVD